MVITMCRCLELEARWITPAQPSETPAARPPAVPTCLQGEGKGSMDEPVLQPEMTIQVSGSWDDKGWYVVWGIPFCRRAARRWFCCSPSPPADVPASPYNAWAAPQPLRTAAWRWRH